jgi:hypothetical protein
MRVTYRSSELDQTATSDARTLRAAMDTNAVQRQGEAVREIVFVDPGLSDTATLIGGVKPGIEAHLLTADEPALKQMARLAASRQGLEAIHVFAHGRPGEVSFSTGALTRESVAREADALSALGAALAADGALHLWACETGAGESGAALLGALAESTGACVLATSGLVGAQALGGNWTLDRAATPARRPLTGGAMAAYAGVMTTFTGGTDNNTLDATTGTITGFTGGTVANLQDTTGDSITGGAGDDSIVAGSGNDTITGGAGKDTIDGGAGNDTFNLANGDFASGESITGNTGADSIVLTNTAAATFDFSAGTISGVETLTGSAVNDTVTMTASQFGSFTTSVNLAAGTDVLNVLVNGTTGNDISASTVAVAGVETGNLTGTSDADSIKLTGAQLDAIIVGTGTIDLGGGNDTINLTTTSADLNTLGGTNASISGVETISASSATAAVTITLGGQTEAFTITGGSGADTIVGGSGADTIDGGAGDDTIKLVNYTFASAGLAPTFSTWSTPARTTSPPARSPASRRSTITRAAA